MHGQQNIKKTCASMFVVKYNKMLRNLLIDILKVEPGIELWTIQLNVMKGTEEILSGEK